MANPKNLTLPDETFEQPQYPELEDLAGQYADARDERQRIQRDEEVPLKTKIIAFMHENGLKFYKRDGLCIELVQKDETVKVKMPGAAPIEDGDGSEE